MARSALFVVPLLAACSPVVFDDEGHAPPPRACVAKVDALAPAAIAALPACCTEGRAHCVDGAKVPAGARSMLSACGAGGSCVPDTMLATGSLRAASCKTASGEGACRSVCIPDVAKAKDELDRATCAEDERCVPCTANGQPTGACVEDTSSCAEDAGARADACTVPTTCTSIAGAEGRCVEASLAPSLPRDVCGAGQTCAPCTDPYAGTATGACSLSCDPGPKKPPVVFPSCCGNLGRCAPPDTVPSADRLYLEECKDDGLCVPVEMTHDFHPHACTTLIGLRGVCLSKCLSIGLFQQDCDADHRCVPCAPGVPGCS